MIALKHLWRNMILSWSCSMHHVSIYLPAHFYLKIANLFSWVMGIPAEIGLSWLPLVKECCALTIYYFTLYYFALVMHTCICCWFFCFFFGEQDQTKQNSLVNTTDTIMTQRQLTVFTWKVWFDRGAVLYHRTSCFRSFNLHYHC